MTTPDELREISFQEDVELLATRLHHAGGATDMKTARAIVEPKLREIRAKQEAERQAEEAEEKETITDNLSPGRSGRRRRGVAIV